MERWSQIERLVDQALDLEAEHRAEFVAQTCVTDPLLGAEVERLLRASEASAGFLAAPALADAWPWLARVAEHQAVAPGDRLGAYLIERELGRGGMATVYLAQDGRHDRPVALKLLRPELSGLLGAERFAREIAIAARLSHPHILPLHDSGSLELDGAPPLLFYAMPYIAGRSLRERLGEEAQLPVEEAVQIARQVADALDHAHRHGIVHRDIKPENILLADGQAVVADFGIARALDVAGAERLTETGLALGTPAYMSPERGGGGRLDGRSDVYALGCVLYEMLAGQPPFPGATPQAIMARHAVDQVPALRTVRATAPRALERVVMRALAKVPADRFPTARVFSEALAAVPDAPAKGRAASTIVVPLLGAIRRRRTVAAALAGGTAIAAVVFAARGRSTRADAPKLDRAVVAITPFRVSAADSSLGYLREGMVDLLAAKLGGTSSLRPTDPRTMLSAWRRASTAGEPTGTRALDVVAQLGAGRLIEGEVVGSGARMSLSAAVRQVPDGRVEARAAIDGSSDSLTLLVDRLAAQLLALSAGDNEPRLASLTTTSLPALRAYLDGQAMVRRGVVDSAERKFGQALGADSTFAAAAFRVALADEGANPDVEHAAREVAWRYRERLSPPDRAQLDVYLGPRYPAPSGYRDVLDAADRFVQLAPGSPEAWSTLAAYLFDYGALVGIPDALQRAQAAVTRSLALDSTYVPGLWGVAPVAAALGDTAGARRGLRLQFGVSDSMASIGITQRWFVAAVVGDTAAIRRALLGDSLAPSWSEGWMGGRPWDMIVMGLYQGLDLRDVDAVLQRALAGAATEAQRATLRANQRTLDIIRGRPGEAARLPAASPDPFSNAQLVIEALFADGDSAEAVPAAAALERQVGSPIGDQCCLPRFAAGEQAIATNRLRLARRAAADLRGFRSAGPDIALDAKLAGAYALILDAQIAARERRPAAAGLLRQLESALGNPFSELVATIGNLICARLEEDGGNLPAALGAVRRRGRGSNPLYVTYHREEGRLAALTGDTAGAIRSYRRYLALRGDAEPRLQPQVREVREALAALERGR